MNDPFAFMRKKAERSFTKKQRSTPTDISNIISNRPPLFSSTPLNSAHLNSDNDITNNEPKQLAQKKNNYRKPNNIHTLSGISPMISVQEQLEEEEIQQSEPTPRKRGRPRKEVSDGVSTAAGKQKKMSPLISVTENLPDEPGQTDAAATKKNGRKKKISKESVRQQEKPDGPTSEDPVECTMPEVCSQESFPAPIEHPLAQEQQGDNFPLIGWLRGSTLPACDEDDDHVNVQTDTLSIGRLPEKIDLILT